jgi:hypothetical protein
VPVIKSKTLVILAVRKSWQQLTVDFLNWEGSAKTWPGNSRGFAFICFPDLESSAAFVHDNYPHIRIDGPNATNMDRHYGKQVSIVFSAERSQQRKEQSWICAIPDVSNQNKRAKS